MLSLAPRRPRPGTIRRVNDSLGLAHVGRQGKADRLEYTADISGDRVVPFRMELIAGDVEAFHLGFADLDALLIAARVECAPYRIPPRPRLSPAPRPVTQIKRLTPLVSIALTRTRVAAETDAFR